MSTRRAFIHSCAAGVACLAAPRLAWADGRIMSGDVSLFYRRFGKPGKTPILITHGINYFDSFDWIGVGGALATDREVVAFDQRGFGESSWSPSKNYSVDALLGDIHAVIAGLGWKQPIVLGHSGSGRLDVAFAASFPDELSRLIIVDSGFEHEDVGPKGTGNPPMVFPSVEAAMAYFAKLANPPRIARDRARAEQALVKTDAGYRLKRDPDYGNVVPISGDAVVRPVRELNVWDELAKVRCPTMIVRGLRSNRWTQELVARTKRDFPRIQWAEVDSMHDVAYYAPTELIAAIRGFV